MTGTKPHQLLHLAVLITLRISLTLCASDCTFTNIPHCSVKAGTAECSYNDLPSVVVSLPHCVTALHFSAGLPLKTPDGTDIDFCITNFSRLVNLTDIRIGVNRDLYKLSGLHIKKSCPQVLYGLNIRHLAVNIEYYNANSSIAIDLLDHASSLQVLDFTRSYDTGLTYFEGLQDFPIKQLILKGCQSLSGIMYKSEIDLDELLCPLGNTLELVDLSFNDIVTITISPKRPLCMKHLRVLDVSYNLLSNIWLNGVNGGNIFIYLSFLYTTEHLIAGHQWYTEADRTEHLWNDEAEHRNITEITPVLEYLNHYMAFAAETCNMSYVKLLECIWEAYPFDVNGSCSFMECMAVNTTQFNYTQCANAGRMEWSIMVTQLMEQRCAYENCMYGVPIPFIPNIKTVLLQSLRALRGILYEVDTNNGTRGICLFPENNLEHLDFSSNFLSGNKVNIQIFSQTSLYGLHKLQVFNFSYIDLPTLHPNITCNMPKLRRLYLGGNNISISGEVPYNMFAGNPKLEVLDLSHMNIEILSPQTFQNLTRLNVLNLSNNRLQGQMYLNISHTQLGELFVNNNNLTGVTIATRQQMEQMKNLSIDLSGNPLSCGCDDIDFIQWMQRQKARINFLSAAKYSCSTGYATYDVFSLDINKLQNECRGNTMLIVEVAVGTVSGTLLILALFTAYKKRWIIRHFIFVTRERLGRRNNRNGYEALENYEYDAFISYSNEDEDRIWVHLTLVPELEKKYGFKLCIHHRDFLGGRDIADNIEEAIMKSRKVIAIMSPSFIASNWCCREIQMTDSVDTRKIIFVKYRDIPSDMDIPRHVSLLMCERTYIEHHDDPAAQKLFWKRLCKSIYQH